MPFASPPTAACPCLTESSSRRCSPSPSFPRLDVRSFYSAPDGRLWLGTESGYTMIDHGLMTRVDAADGLDGGNINSIVATAGGVLWFATDNGLARLDPGFANFSTKDGLADNRVFDLRTAPGGGCWVGMEWGGVARYDGRQFDTLAPGLYARRLRLDSGGVLWIGCNKGVQRLKDERLLPDALLESRWGMAIELDSEGALWFGDGWSGGGLTRVWTNAAGGLAQRTYTREEGLPDNEVNVNPRCSG